MAKKPATKAKPRPASPASNRKQRITKPKKRSRAGEKRATRSAKPSGKRNVGRPTKYDMIRHPLQAEALASKGYIEIEIADIIGVAMSTISEWKLKHPEFRDAMLQGKDPVDQVVEGELLRNCKTRQVTKTTEETRPDPSNSKKTITINRVETHEETGKVAAQRLWLINRRPRDWRDRKDIHVNDDRALQEATDEELDKELDRYGKILGEEASDPETEGKGKA